MKPSEVFDDTEEIVHALALMVNDGEIDDYYIMEAMVSLEAMYAEICKND